MSSRQASLPTCCQAGCCATHGHNPLDCKCDIDWESTVWRDLTHEEAKGASTSGGHGLMLDGMSDYHPGIQCITCGRFVGRDGSIHVEHFEMSMEIASIDGECRRCLDRERVA